MARVYTQQEIDEAQRAFEGLCAALNEVPNARGEVDYPCPNCHHEVVKGKVHFSFSFKGGRCFACGYSAGIFKVAKELGVRPRMDRPVQVRQKPVKIQDRPWQRDPLPYLERYCAALDRVTLWQAYKPVSLETIAKHRLGVGVLPSTLCQHKRLIVPIFANGQVVGFRGRLIACDCAERRAAGKEPVCRQIVDRATGEVKACECPKWLNAGGTANVLFNADALHDGCDVIICENNVDCLLYQQVNPAKVAVSPVMGASTWLEEFTAQIAAAHPVGVTVVYDNDFPGGLPNDETYQVMLREWKQRNPAARTVPIPNGIKVANALAEAQLRVERYRWPKGTQRHMDLGTALGPYLSRG